MWEPVCVRGPSQFHPCGEKKKFRKKKKKKLENQRAFWEMEPHGNPNGHTFELAPGLVLTSAFDSGNCARAELAAAGSGARAASDHIRVWTTPDAAGTPHETAFRSWFHFRVTADPGYGLLGWVFFLIYHSCLHVHKCVLAVVEWQIV
jgi:hypothetical protein